MRHTLLIGQTNQSICPVNVMKHYFTRRGTTPGPLFIFASGRPLTKDALTAETRQLLSHLGCQASDYAFHSYRIGAATAANIGKQTTAAMATELWQQLPTHIKDLSTYNFPKTLNEYLLAEQLAY